LHALELGIAGIVLITLLVQTVVWRGTTYAVDADAISIRSGLLVRQTRHLRLDRLQAVDVVRPLAARVLRLTELRIEVAGAGKSRVSLRYLSAAEAEALRAQILGLSHGVEGIAVTAPALVEPFYVVPNAHVLGGFLLSHPLVVLVIPVGIVAWLVGFVTAATFGGLAGGGVVGARIGAPRDGLGQLPHQRCTRRVAPEPWAARHPRADGPARPRARRVDRAAAAVARVRLGASRGDDRRLRP